DVWTRKQKRLGLPYLPPQPDLGTLSKEPFLFYVKSNGDYVGTSHAGDYFSTDRFHYEYEPGSGDETRLAAAKTKHTTMSLRGEMKGQTGALAIPHASVNAHLASAEATL